MPIHLESKVLINAQQMEVAVNGPDGATHLILCTGVADLGALSDEAYIFFVGPQLSRRQFVRAIASGALSKIEAHEKSPAEKSHDTELGANLALIYADYDDKSGQVKVRAEVSSSLRVTSLSISYQVSILAELPRL